MHSPNATPPHRAADQLRSLVRLAVVALRRTAFENSANLLAVAASLVLLADGARRVNGPHALDRWLVAALTVIVVLPVALGSHDPLRSARVALLPVPRRVLLHARVIASAPLRLPLAALLVIAGSVPTYRVASSAAMLTLVGWGIASFFVGAALEERWHGARAVAVRSMAAAMASIGAWCLWSLRSAEPSVTVIASTSWIPALLPRGDGAADWLIALGALASSAALGVVVLRAPRGSETAARLVSVQENPVVGRRRVRMFNGTSFPRIVRPSVAHEVALLARHVGSRTSLAVVAALACAACYGRVPGLALVAITPMILLAANMLGADVALGGLTRHRLQPASLTQLRDRRLTVWSVSAALVAVLGAIVGLMLPSPETAGTPTGGVFGAPAMLLYAVTLIPWFGRASWWWARRYPQPLARRVYEVGAPVATGPMGPAHLALGLFASWARVALLAALLWAAGNAVLRAVLNQLASVDTPVATIEQLSWIGAALLSGGVAGVAHVALSARLPRAAATRIVVGREANR